MSIANSLRNIKRSYSIFRKTTLLHKLLYFLAFAICISLMANYGRKPVEGFEKKTNEFDMRDDVMNIYDDFYVSIYDDLVFNKRKNDYEVGQIIKLTKPNDKSRFLDIGSGTGHHISSLKAHGFNAVGVDISPGMIKKAKQTYPELEFKQADVLDAMIFSEASFTHITCFYFTLYYIKNKEKLFENCYKWLIPGGYLAVHTVNRDKFDPILPAGNPFGIISPQKYAKKRITSTTVKFDSMEYKSNFDMKETVTSSDSPNALMVETFKNLKTGNVRKNEHKLFMNTQAEILDMAKKLGFIIHAKIDLMTCQYESQYIYILQKPT
jgi:SAM-dependent methyltransferase